jgi:SAM-dependent methyltransferase
VNQPNNPQRAQMSDESMVWNLAAQAEAIWPQERQLIERYALPAGARILDLGCGTGEISERLLTELPGSRLHGLDLDAAHLERARRRCARFGDRARFVEADAAEPIRGIEPGSFDLAVCRHLLQAVPVPERVIANMRAALRPGGRLHVVAEDYGMMHFWPATRDLDAFWKSGPVVFATALGTDLLSGRKVFTWMREHGLAEVRLDYVVIDTVRVPRPTFARIWRAWKDGFAAAIAAHSALDLAEVTACFDEMIACIENPDGYAVWQLPVITASVPG